MKRTWQLLERNYAAEKANKDVAKITFDQIWANDKYAVFIRFNHKQPSGIDVTWLSIKRHDQEPCSDWRDFQFIKNQLCGEDCEAIQIYPAESRMVDTANQYHLFVLPKGVIIPFGFFDGRTIGELSTNGSRQRAWPINMRPHDMDEQNKNLENKLKEFYKRYHQ